jgi:hypothetical protein
MSRGAIIIIGHDKAEYKYIPITDLCTDHSRIASFPYGNVMYTVVVTQANLPINPECANCIKCITCAKKYAVVVDCSSKCRNSCQQITKESKECERKAIIEGQRNGLSGNELETFVKKYINDNMIKYGLLCSICRVDYIVDPYSRHLYDAEEEKISK